MGCFMRRSFLTLPDAKSREKVLLLIKKLIYIGKATASNMRCMTAKLSKLNIERGVWVFYESTRMFDLPTDVSQ